MQIVLDLKQVVQRQDHVACGLVQVGELLLVHYLKILLFSESDWRPTSFTLRNFQDFEMAATSSTLLFSLSRKLIFRQIADEHTFLSLTR